MPSVPVPDSTMQTAFSPWSPARDMKNVSIGMRCSRGGAGRSTRRMPPLMVSVASGGMTETLLAEAGMPSSASRTGIAVWRAISSTSMLLWFGSRCWTRTNAMSLSAGMAAKNALNALRPPAEAPMPTIRGASLGWGGGAVGTAGLSEGLAPV